MKTLGEIELELSRLGFRNRVYCKAEVRELRQILHDDEIMINVTTGRYEGGRAMLLATDRRLLLIDKKIWYLSLEDVRFDMISEIDYHARLLDSTVFIRTINKVLKFTSMHQVTLRALVKYVQEMVMELRQQPVTRERHQPSAPQFSTSLPLDPPVSQLTTQVLESSQPMIPTPRVHMKAFRRIGAYPTASFTIHRQDSGIRTPSLNHN
jgi:hypothetical protein